MICSALGWIVFLQLLHKCTGTEGVLDGPSSGVYYRSDYCPGPETEGDSDCKCAFTLANASGWDGSCPAGYYCPYGNSTAISCNFGDNASNPTQGLYCPENTQTPRYCCKGYYCPSSTEIKICPSGDYCKAGPPPFPAPSYHSPAPTVTSTPVLTLTSVFPAGSIESISCPWLTQCDEKTSNPLNAVPLTLMIISVAATWIIHSQCTACRQRELLEHSLELDRVEKITKQGAHAPGSLAFSCPHDLITSAVPPPPPPPQVLCWSQRISSALTSAVSADCSVEVLVLRRLNDSRAVRSFRGH